MDMWIPFNCGNSFIYPSWSGNEMSGSATGLVVKLSSSSFATCARMLADNGFSLGSSIPRVQSQDGHERPCHMEVVRC